MQVWIDESTLLSVEEHEGTPYISGPDAEMRNKRAERVRIARTLVREKWLLMESAGFKYVRGPKPGTGKWVHEMGKSLPDAVYTKMNLSAVAARLELLVGFKQVAAGK